MTNKQETNQSRFWQDQGEREFIYILVLSLIIIGLIILFSFSATGKATIKTSLNYLSNFYRDSGWFEVQADQELAPQKSLIEVDPVFFRDLKVKRISPNKIETENLILDKIKSSIYNKVEQEKEVALASGDPIYTKGKYLEVDLSSQTMTLYKDGINKGNYLVSTGSSYYPTPTGEYKINSKTLKAYSAKYDLYMPYWMAFIGSSYGIHELPETSSGIKEGESSLGVPVSHGCIRLGVGAAARVYQFAPVGTKVYIHQ
jgi:lipoprotein-anchoring transpeptidase ErfK/SrfK